MISLSSLLLLAEDAVPAATTGGGNTGILMLVLMIAMMYFMVIRPQRRQAKEQAERISALRTGDKIITTGGIYGLVTNVKTHTLILKIADNVRIEIAKASVGTVLTKADGPEDESDPSEDAPVEKA